MSNKSFEVSEVLKSAVSPLTHIHPWMTWQNLLSKSDEWVWVWFLKSKDKKATAAVLKEFKAYAENQFDCKIKRVRTDNNTGEFMNNEWKEIIILTGIQHESSPPYDQAKNGVIE